MRKYFSRASIFPISVIVGLAVGYLPATLYFKDGGEDILKGSPIIDTSFTTVRGVVRGVDTHSKTMTFVAVSPYSPHESAPFNITYDNTTLFLAAPASPEFPNMFLPTDDVQETDAAHVIVGTPVTVRVSRSPGRLHASWIVVRSPLQ